jgi:hypothetical protein
MVSKAPGMRLYVMDDHIPVVSKPPARDVSPLELLRMFSFDPREFRGEEGLTFALMMPDPWEWFDRGRMRQNPDRWLEDSRRWQNDDELWGALDPANCGVFLHRQFEEKAVYMPPDRDWLFPARTRMATCNYPQPHGRHNLKQFAHILSRSTPRLICWMWCDSGIPVGHEASMREFAYAYRRLPLGAYRTVWHDGNVTARTHDEGLAFYVVNTGHEETTAKPTDLPPGTYRGAASGKTVAVTDDAAEVRLRPYELCVFVREGSEPPH